MYKCSIIILEVETSLSIITFGVTKEVGVLQRQDPKHFLVMMKIIQPKAQGQLQYGLPKQKHKMITMTCDKNTHIIFPFNNLCFS
jgi:hypothetical protein